MYCVIGGTGSNPVRTYNFNFDGSCGLIGYDGGL